MIVQFASWLWLMNSYAIARKAIRSRRWHCIISLSCCLAVSSPALGVQVRGHIRSGGYSSEVKLKDDISGLGNNNASVISNRLNMTVFDFNQSQDEVKIDFRDRYNFFGRADRELLELREDNTIELRELAYQRPWQKHRLYFTAGRFIPKEAGLITNDGAEVGYRLSRDNRVGALVGIADQSIVTPLSIKSDPRGYNGNQAGAYWVYDQSHPRRPNSLYMTNAIAQGPSFELVEYVNKVYFYHLSLLQFGPHHRVSSHLNFDIQPEAKLRQANVSYGYYSPRYRLTSHFIRVSPEENRLQQDIQDELVASTVDTVSLNLIQRLTAVLSLEYRGQISRRDADGRQQQVLGFGSRYLGLLRGRMSVGALLGLRNNYVSDDLFFDTRLDYYQSKWSVHLEQNFRQRSYDNDGPSILETESRGELAFYFGERLRGSAAFSMISSEKVEIATMFLMIGYYFGSGTTSPTRAISPIFQEI